VNRTQKAETVASLKGIFAEAGLVVVTHNTGLNVAEISELRRRMREAGARFRIAKNRLTKRALSGTPYEALADYFTGPTALAYSDDEVAAAKVVVGFAKENDALVVLGGAIGTTALDADAVKALAALPSLDELRAQLIALINAPATKIAGVLQAPAGQLARVFGAYGSQGGAAQAPEDQKETENG
jgi:large subunit ribosomal protein L10